MKISKVTYIENGYFEVKYTNIDSIIVQDITAIKMTIPTDPVIKDILLFLRGLKLEKLQNEKDFNDLKYRNHIVYDFSSTIDAIKMQEDLKSISYIIL